MAASRLPEFRLVSIEGSSPALAIVDGLLAWMLRREKCLWRILSYC
jgi:hypothetical protein